jgi:hypothetical protein
MKGSGGGGAGGWMMGTEEDYTDPNMGEYRHHGIGISGHAGEAQYPIQMHPNPSTTAPEERTPHPAAAASSGAGPGSAFGPTHSAPSRTGGGPARGPHDRRPPSLSISGSQARPQIGLGDILADDFYQQAAAFRRRVPSTGSASATLPPLSAVSFNGQDPFGIGGSPGLPLSPSDLRGDAEGVGEDILSNEDPLATQVWRLYARTKATLPHAQRMENLTWRMMAMALRRRREADANARANPSGAGGARYGAQEAAARALLTEEGDELKPLTVAEGEGAGSRDGGRGRNIDKGRKAKMRVEGFHTADGDDIEQAETG